MGVGGVGGRGEEWEGGNRGKARALTHTHHMFSLHTSNASALSEQNSTQFDSAKQSEQELVPAV